MDGRGPFFFMLKYRPSEILPLFLFANRQGVRPHCDYMLHCLLILIYYHSDSVLLFHISEGSDHHLQYHSTLVHKHQQPKARFLWAKGTARRCPLFGYTTYDKAPLEPHH